MKSDVIVAVDFGTTKIAMAAAMREADGRLKVLGVETKTTPVGFIVNGQIAKPTDCAGVVLELSKLLNNRLGNLKIKINSTFVSVGGRSLHSIEVVKSNSFPSPMQVTDSMLEMLRDQVSQADSENIFVFECFALGYELDGNFFTNPIGEVCTSISAHYLIIEGKQVINNNLVKVFDRTSLTIEEYQFAPLATAQALLSDQQKKQGCLLIDFGASNTSFVIYKDGKMFQAAVVPFGSKEITTDIAAVFSIPSLEAENLKKTRGMAVYEMASLDNNSTIDTSGQQIDVSDFAKVIQAREEEILNFIWQRIKAYHLEKELAAGVIITGGGSKLRFLDQLISNRFGLPTIRGNVQEHLSASNFTMLQSAEYAQLVGQLLLGRVNCVSAVESIPIEQPLQKVEKKKKSHKIFGISKNFFDSTSTVEE